MQDTGNVISLEQYNVNDETIYAPRLKDVDFDALVETVREELVALLQNIMPHNPDKDDIRIIKEVFAEVLIDDSVRNPE